MTTRKTIAPAACDLHLPGNVIARAWQAMTRRFEHRAARHALQRMDDFMLKDIGLIRSDIEAAVQGRIHRGRLTMPRKPGCRTSLGGPAHGPCHSGAPAGRAGDQ